METSRSQTNFLFTRFLGSLSILGFQFFCCLNNCCSFDFPRVILRNALTSFLASVSLVLHYDTLLLSLAFSFETEWSVEHIFSLLISSCHRSAKSKLHSVLFCISKLRLRCIKKFSRHFHLKSS